MPKGGYRPGAGRPRKTRIVTPPAEDDLVGPIGAGDEPVAPPSTREGEANVVGQDPVDYMLNVLKDPGASPDRKDRIAIALAPYIHAKVGESGKKGQQKKAAEKAGSGRFGSMPPPKQSS